MNASKYTYVKVAHLKIKSVIIVGIRDIEKNPEKKRIQNFKMGKNTKWRKNILKTAYLQIPLKEKCTNLLTIKNTKGLYKFNRLPFGINVPYRDSRITENGNNKGNLLWSYWPKQM